MIIHCRYSFLRHPFLIFRFLCCIKTSMKMAFCFPKQIPLQLVLQVIIALPVTSITDKKMSWRRNNNLSLLSICLRLRLAFCLSKSLQDLFSSNGQSLWKNNNQNLVKKTPSEKKSPKHVQKVIHITTADHFHYLYSDELSSIISLSVFWLLQRAQIRTVGDGHGGLFHVSKKKILVTSSSCSLPSAMRSVISTNKSVYSPTMKTFRARKDSKIFKIRTVLRLRQSHWVNCRSLTINCC